MLYLCFSGVGWCLQRSGACLSATTAPQVPTGRAASAAALCSYRPSWPTVTATRHSHTHVVRLHAVPRGHERRLFGADRPAESSGLVGGERAARSPAVAVWESAGFAVPLAVPACLGPGPGDAAAGCRPPAGSLSGGRNHL